MDSPHFSPEESERIKDIVILYQKFKDLMLYADELKTESFVPAINEARDAYDHFMRSFAAKYGLVEDDDYAIENLNATFRHLYRGIYDFLDYIRIQQKDLIDHMLDGYSKETILAVLPQYYSEIRPDILSLIDDIPEFKKGKDIGKPDIDRIDEYIETVKKIKLHLESIQRKEAGLIEFECRLQQEIKKKRRNEILKQAVIILVSGIVGAILGVVLGIYIIP